MRGKNEKILPIFCFLFFLCIFLVGCKEPTETGISVTANPAKTVYYEGETFDKTGMTVKVNFSDNTSKEITDYNVDTKIRGEIMRRTRNTFLIFYLITLLLYTLAIIYIPQVNRFLQLNENEIVDRWVIIICVALLLVYFLTIITRRQIEIFWLISAMVSLLVYIIFEYFVIASNISQTAYALTFILFGMFILIMILRSILKRLKWIYDPFLIDKPKVILSAIMTMLMMLVFIPVNQTATMMDRLFAKVENIVFEKNEDAYVSEDIATVGKNIPVRFIW